MKMTAQEIKKQIKDLQKELDQVMAAPPISAVDEEIVAIALQVKALAKVKDVSPRLVAEFVCRRLRTGFIYDKSEIEVEELVERVAKAESAVKKPAAKTVTKKPAAE